mmetsp:Transcript_5873/g.8307  ORF Transcript_5873/g.8307 Transcript_5873/m.8307 type:complete len:180 (-) Transcript_5873:75-614(-)
MDKLITSVAEKIGVDESKTRKAIGAIFKFLKSQSGTYDFDSILKKIGSDAETLMKEAESETTTASTEGETSTTRSTSSSTSLFGLVFTLLKTFGVLTMLKQLLSTFFGESAVKLIESVEDGADLTVVLNQAGIDRDQGVKMVRMVVDFLKEKAGGDTVENLLEQIPAAKAFLGDSKKDE